MKLSPFLSKALTTALVVAFCLLVLIGTVITAWWGGGQTFFGVLAGGREWLFVGKGIARGLAV